MKELALLNKCLFTTIGGVVGFVVGEVDSFFYALLLFIVLDYITGVMAAIVERNLSSQIGKKGIFQKVMILCLVAVGHLIDTHLLKQGGTVRTAVIFFYISNEGLSILENATRLGLPIPSRVRKVLRLLQEEIEKE